MGGGYGLVWFGLTVWLARRYFGAVVRWPVSDFLRLKDTFPLGPDVLGGERRQTLCSKQA